MLKQDYLMYYFFKYDMEMQYKCLFATALVCYLNDVNYLHKNFTFFPIPIIEGRKSFIYFLSKCNIFIFF